jgi:flagellar biosynthetic protein FliR
VRTVLAIAIAFGLTPVVAHGVKLPTDALAFVGLMLEGFVVGFAIAFAVACMFAAVQSAGILSDALSGMSFGSTIDPMNGNPGGSLANLYAMVGMGLFLAIGGDEWALRGLAATFRVVPLGGGPRVTSVVSGAVSAFGSVLVGAVEVAAPVMLTLVITDIALGVISKVVPQLNVFAVGFPFKIGVTLLTVAVAIPFVGGWMSNQLADSVGAAIQTLG